MNRKPNKKYSDETPLDNYERKLQEFLDKGEYIGNESFIATKEMLEESARRYVELQKNKSITLRVNKQTLIKVKAKAKRNKIPYQTLIGLLINQYADGKAELIL